MSGTGLVVCAVCGETPSGVEQLLGVAVVGGHEADAAELGDPLDDPAEAAVGRLDRLDDGRDHAGVADHVRVREVDDAKP